MSSTDVMAPENRSLADRQPELPALPVLLSDVTLGDWLGEAVTGVVRRRRLRLKPGTSCVLSATVDDGERTRAVLVAAYAEEAHAKLAKAEQQASHGAVLAYDVERRLIALDADADRALPGVAAVVHPATRAATLERALGRSLDPDHLEVRTLSYNPHRRWVATIGSGTQRLLVRAYRPAALPRAEEAFRVMRKVGAPVPALLGRRRGLGLLVAEFVPGAAVEPDSPAPVLHRAGRALAAIHGGRARKKLPPPTPRQLAAARRTLGAVALLLPDRAGDLELLHDLVGVRLHECDPGRRWVGLHGDFSLDQMVDGPAGLRVIDLDHAQLGPAAHDLGNLVAELLSRPGCTATEATAAYEAVLTGYAAVRRPPPEDYVRAWVAEHLLRRAADPFRHCLPDWPSQVRRMLDHARELAEGGVR